MNGATKSARPSRGRGPSPTSSRTRARVLAKLTACALEGDAACARVLLDLQQANGERDRACSHAEA
jgi:hypothetical protein